MITETLLTHSDTDCYTKLRFFQKTNSQITFTFFDYLGLTIRLYVFSYYCWEFGFVSAIFFAIKQFIK